MTKIERMIWRMLLSEKVLNEKAVKKLSNKIYKAIKKNVVLIDMEELDKLFGKGE